MIIFTSRDRIVITHALFPDLYVSGGYRITNPPNSTIP